MPQEHRNSRKSSWINVVVLALLLVTGGFTLTACQQAESGGESTREEKNQPTKANENNDEDEEKDEEEDEAKDTQEDDDPE
jgi:cytoskeletal protein RodZ